MDLPVTVEKTLPAPVAKVWAAITDRDQMKEWYFDFVEFRPVPGFRFEFLGGPENGPQYLHKCEIQEAEPEKKISYSWRYEGYDGDSLVTFTLQPVENSTHLKLTHEGLETFPSEVSDFARKNFEAGWSHIIGTSLVDFLSRPKEN